MMKKYIKRMLMISLVLVLAFSSVACGKRSGPTLRVAFLTNTNQFNEKGGMNEQIRDTLSSYNGGNVHVKIFQPAAQEEQVPTLRDLAASEEYDLILCAGYTTGKAVDVVAQEYQNQLFGTIDYISNESNVFSIVFSEEQAAFYCGVLAALLTETNVVGFVGSFEGVDEEYYYGFKTGALSVDANITIVEGYTKAYEDLSSAADIVQNFASADADVFFCAAAAPTTRLVELAEEQGIKVLNSDIYSYSQESMALACVVNKKYASSVEYILNMAAEYVSRPDEGEASAYISDLRYVGIAQNAFHFQLASFVETDIKNEMDEWVAIFQNNTPPIIVPRDASSFENFDYSIFDGSADVE